VIQERHCSLLAACILTVSGTVLAYSKMVSDVFLHSAKFGVFAAGQAYGARVRRRRLGKNVLIILENFKLSTEIRGIAPVWL